MQRGYREYYLVNVFIKDGEEIFIQGAIRFEQEEKKQAVEYWKFVRSLDNYTASITPKLERC